MKNNQKSIITWHSYGAIPYNLLEEAMSNLNGNALKLFIFLCAINEGEPYPFSPKYFCQVTNVSPSGEKTAFYELISKKYLVEKEEDLFEFCPTKNDKQMSDFVYPQTDSVYI